MERWPIEYCEPTFTCKSAVYLFSAVYQTSIIVFKKSSTCILNPTQKHDKVLTFQLPCCSLHQSMHNNGKVQLCIVTSIYSGLLWVLFIMISMASGCVFVVFDLALVSNSLRWLYPGLCLEAVPFQPTKWRTNASLICKMSMFHLIEDGAVQSRHVLLWPIFPRIMGLWG